jgi:glutathione S-transferase
MMLTIHHLGISQSERIIWLCEELGIDYALVHHDRDPATRLAPASYKALPAPTSPALASGPPFVTPGKRPTLICR